jgi:hypothetical protein
MLQTASTTNATQGPDRHRVAVLTSDHDPLLAIRMCPHLVRAALAHDAPARIGQCIPDRLVRLRRPTTVRLRADGTWPPSSTAGVAATSPQRSGRTAESVAARKNAHRTPGTSIQAFRFGRNSSHKPTSSATDRGQLRRRPTARRSPPRRPSLVLAIATSPSWSRDSTPGPKPIASARLAAAQVAPVPEPAGQVGTRHYWIRSEVDQWEGSRRRRRPTSPSPKPDGR